MPPEKIRKPEVFWSFGKVLTETTGVKLVRLCLGFIELDNESSEWKGKGETQKQQVFWKKGVLKNFSKFTRKETLS